MILRLLLALAAGLVVAYAETACVRAIASRKAIAAGSWDLVLNVLGLAIVLSLDPVVFVAYAIGSAVSTAYATKSLA